MRDDVDSQQFRRVLSCYPTGVVLVCADTPIGPVGMACNSFTAVSLEPALVAICPAKSSATWPQIRAAGRFCVTVLAESCEELSVRFARKDADRFATVEVQPRSHGPAIPDGIAWLDCVLQDEIPAGDHTIALGRVMGLEDREGEAFPLVFWRSRYATVSHSVTPAVVGPVPRARSPE